MARAAIHTLAPGAVVAFATVVERSGPDLRVSARGRELGAQLAPSCVVAPSPGDRVLLVHAGEEAYVLAVLKQARPGETELAFERDVTLRVKDGRLRLLADRAIE